jgi:hypothetical protein
MEKCGDRAMGIGLYTQISIGSSVVDFIYFKTILVGA